MRATYYPSLVPGLCCAALSDDGPPRARIHDRLVLFTIVTGEAVVWCRGEIHLLQPGSLLLVEPGETHRDLRKTNYRAVMVLVRPELLKTFRGCDADRLGPVVLRSPALCARLMALVDAVREDQAPLKQEVHVARVMSDLQSLWTQRPPSQNPPLVAKARRALDEMTTDVLSIEELAGRLGCGSTYLSRVFGECTGVPPHAYQLLKRLLLARTLIEEGETVKTAAHLAGFADESHLHRHFRRRFAVAPGQYPKGDSEMDEDTGVRHGMASMVRSSSGEFDGGSEKLETFNSNTGPRR